MHAWFKWLTYINPVGYAFESLISNEFHNHDFNCTAERIVPPYAQEANGDFVCAVRGSVPNQLFVSGDAYIGTNYDYFYKHIWRNLGILYTFLVFFVILYLVISERNVALPISTDGLIFRREHSQKDVAESKIEPPSTTQSSADGLAVGKQPRLDLVHTRTFSWSNVCYDIQTNGEVKTLVDHISGWVKPGTLTALMVSLFRLKPALVLTCASGSLRGG
jgi:hypothetical protein